MIIIATLVVLFLVFFMLRKNVGPTVLAILAGLSVYEMFGVDIANSISHQISGVPLELIKNCIYLVFVLLFPILLYVRSHRSGLFGLFRLLEAAVISVLLTSLLASTISYFCPFDSLAKDILGFIATIKGPVLMASIIAAYLDVILYHG